jgi:hypothetical protein
MLASEKGQAITALARHYICVILTRMVSSCLGIAPKPNGP